MMYKPLFHVVMLCSSHSTYHSELVVVIIYLFSLPELVSLMMLSERYNLKKRLLLHIRIV